MVLCLSVCCIDWCLDYHGRAACNQVPAVCYAAPVSCEALAPFYQPWALSRVWLGKKWALPEPYHKEVLLFTGELMLKKLPWGEKEHDRILHELFLAVISPWLAKHRLVSGGHLEMEMNQLALFEKKEWTIPPIMFWVHLIGPVYPWLSYTVCEVISRI